MGVSTFTFKRKDVYHWKRTIFKKLEKLVEHAKSKHNTLDAGEINDFHRGQPVSRADGSDYSYLENRNIDVVPVLDEAMLNADPLWMTLAWILIWTMTAS